MCETTQNFKSNRTVHVLNELKDELQLETGRLSTTYSPSIPVWVGMDPRVASQLSEYNRSTPGILAGGYNALRRQHGGFPDLMPITGWEPGEHEQLKLNVKKMKAVFGGVYLMKGINDNGVTLYKIGHSNSAMQRAQELNRTMSFTGRPKPAYASMNWNVLCSVYSDGFGDRSTREKAERSAHENFKDSKLRGRKELELFKEVSQKDFLKWAFTHYPDAVTASLVPDEEYVSTDKLAQAVRVRIDYVEPWQKTRSDNLKSLFQRIFQAPFRHKSYAHVTNPTIVRLFELIKNNRGVAALAFREMALYNGALDYPPLSSQRPFLEKAYATHLKYCEEYFVFSDDKYLPNIDQLLTEAEKRERDEFDVAIW